MENLHSDATLNILGRLPVESVLDCKRVCKNWQSILRNTKVGLLFSICFPNEDYSIRLYYGGDYDNNEDDDKYSNKYSYKTLTALDHPPLEFFPVIGSCNGLVCCFVNHDGIDDPIYICNPITREFVNLPRFDVIVREDDSWAVNPDRLLKDIIVTGDAMANGFGYLHSTNEYKVLRVYYPSKTRYKGLVQVYTLGDGKGWRDKGLTTHYLNDTAGIFANGALHWIDTKKRRMVAFDLADEEFRLLALPHCTCDCDYSPYGLKLLGGYLCCVHKLPGQRLEIWSLKKKKKNSKSSYYVKDHEYNSWSWSWRRDFSIPWEGSDKDSYDPFALTKSNEVLLWYNVRILRCYDTKTATFKTLCDHDKDLGGVQVIPHMNSFVSLKALGEKSKIRR